uniref:Uncharacterized protein n=1 Tax=Electrophorus electricus TaxID=8005 RepID=A0A4W4H3T6_ELEEL
MLWVLETTLFPSPHGALPRWMRLYFYGMHGLTLDIVLSSAHRFVYDNDLKLGHTSIWSFLMYGSCSFVVDRLYLHLHFTRGWGRWRRMPLYICLIYTWEFCWGAVLRHYGACSWDYSHYPLNFMGLVTLLYLPGWFCLSLYQDVLSDVLLRVVYTEDSAGVTLSGRSGGVYGASSWLGSSA